MDFEDQEEEHERETGLGPSHYDSVGNSNSTLPGAKVANPIEMSAARKPRYRECLKNHAVSVGGHAVDGCCEFMAAGEEGTMESLKCAACHCHRNFHRKETERSISFPFSFQQHNQQTLTQHPHGHFSYKGQGGYLHMGPALQRSAPLALPSSSGGGGGSELEDYYSNPSSSGGKKRFRTKFTPEQKDKMLGFAEQLGWRIQKQDEEIVQQFCTEVGLKRHVLKVWMHNNKHTLGKKT